MSIPCGHGMFNGYRSSKPLSKTEAAFMPLFAVLAVVIGTPIIAFLSLTGMLSKNGERQ